MNILKQNQPALFHGKPLLLIVDDQASNIQTLYEIFKNECEVCMATNGADAIAFCEKRLPDLILLDVIMPDMSGHAVCAHFKNNSLTQNIPLIFVTAQSDPIEESLGFAQGAVDFISKPFNANVVRARVQTHLTLKYQSDLLRSLSLTDGLTNVANRRAFDNMLQSHWRGTLRMQQPLSLVMIDVDFFKGYNDFYGHQAGDQCLKSIAATLQANITRPHDLLARYGGEEFAAILPNTPLVGAEKKARKLEQAIRELHIPNTASTASEFVTISLGVATIIPAQGDDFIDLISCADSQLYLAKQSGRGRVCAKSVKQLAAVKTR